VLSLMLIAPAEFVTEPATLHRFVAPGGTIGRAPGNDLVLPDSARSVSRVHVRIQFRREGPRAVCVGTNAIQVNGTPIEQGEECTIDIGDRLQVGAFLLKAIA